MQVAGLSVVTATRGHRPPLRTAVYVSKSHEKRETVMWVVNYMFSESSTPNLTDNKLV